MARYHPGAPIEDNKGKKIWYYCPGEPCPESYQMPQDWDVLGEVPPPNSRTPNPLPPPATTATPGTQPAQSLLIRDQVQSQK